jgi:HK97 family phage major capsid protein
VDSGTTGRLKEAAVSVKIPTSPEQLEESLNDKATVKALFEGPDDLKAYIKGYAKEFAKADKGEVDAQIRDQVNEAVGPEVQRLLAEYLKDHPAETVPVAAARLASGARGVLSSAERGLYNQYGKGTKLDGIFDSPSECFRASWHHADRLKDRALLGPKMAKAMGIMNSFGSEVPDAGGFLIPEHLRSEILQIALETAVVRPRATVIPMDSLRVPIPILDDTTHASSVFGGVTAYWTEEAAALTESQATFGRVVLDAKKLTAFANVPNELLQDAPAFAGFFDSKFPLALAWFEDVAFFGGDGAGQPTGFIGCAASVSVTKESGQAAATIVWENLVKAYARMLPTSLGNAVWVANIETFPELATMALSVGTGGGPVWMGNYTNPGAATPPVAILGRPVYFTEKASALGTSGDINLVDLSYYLIGDRMQMESMSSPHYKFNQDMTSFRIIQRLDGQPWLQSALTPHKGSSTLSAFVQIAAR